MTFKPTSTKIIYIIQLQCNRYSTYSELHAKTESNEKGRRKDCDKDIIPLISFKHSQVRTNLKTMIQPLAFS